MTEFFLILARLLPFFVTSGYGPLQRLPGFIRVILLCTFTLFCSFLVEQPLDITSLDFFLTFVSELFIGIVLFFVLQLVFVAISFWGRVIDMQIGFGAAGVVDPTNKNQEPLLGSIFVTAAICLFYLLDIHHEVIRALVFSFEVLPLGSNVFNANLPNLASLITIIFSAGFFIFGPVMILMWCLDIFIGLLSRTMPQMNIYFVMLPLKIFVGIFLLSIFSLQSRAIFERLFEQALRFWGRILS